MAFPLQCSPRTLLSPSRGAETLVPSGLRTALNQPPRDASAMTNDYQQAQLLVELAATVAYHGEAFLRSTASVSRKGIESYWLASRNRIDAWSAGLKQLETEVQRQEAEEAVLAAGQRESIWDDLLPLAEEVLASEILTRVWAALGCAFDARTQTDDVAPFVRSALVSHLESRHRMLRFVMERSELSSERIRHIDRIRRQAERWTDVLLGYLIHYTDIREFAFDDNRVEDFALSLRNPSSSTDMVKSLLLVSLRTTFGPGFSGACPHPQLNGEICQAVLSCFAADVLDAIGPFQSVWEVRLSQTADDTQGMLDCLAAEIRSSPARQHPRR